MDGFSVLQLDIDFPLSTIVFECWYTFQLLSSFEIIEDIIQTGDDFFNS